ncbi:uncharacterized protein JCM6883_000691 [Sporobolomyces salmoneus]|uniref:uncharacterized protein n=1 Tax=Sporobolomyces salmoneus TaxID=183962 RepID=UPI00317E29E5
MSEEQPTTERGAGGKKARRGRRQDDTLPPSRSRDVQRAFRARRAAHLSHLEATVAWLTAENSALREKCDLPQDGPPLTGPPPVEEVIDGPAEPVAIKKPGRAKATAKKPKSGGGAIAEDQSEAESSRMDEDVSPQPQDDARGAAEVLVAGTPGGGGEQQNSTHGFSLPPMNLPSSSTSPSIAHNQPPPPAPYNLPQQSSPHAQAAPAFQPHPSHIPYLVNHPHASVSYPPQSLTAYAPSQYPNPYAPYPGNPNMQNYGSYWPPNPQQHQFSHQAHTGNPNVHNGGVFPMSLPPSDQNGQQPYPSESYPPSQRNSISSTVTPSPQVSTPPSSHLRSVTNPSPGRPQQQPPHVYPTLVPPLSSNFPLKSANPSFPLKPDNQPQQQPMSFDSIFPTPSPEDEQFFLDTFCGMANDNAFLQSLYPPPEAYEIASTTTNNEVQSNREAGNVNKVEKEEEDTERKNVEIDAQSYKTFCVGLMKGVKGIEGLIAQKRKRDRESGESTGGHDKKRRKSNDGTRQEKEDETVAFLAEAAAMASSGVKEGEEECCAGIIDCGPSSTKEQTEESKKEGECCSGLIDCGPVATNENQKETKKRKKEEDGEDCCSGLISCASGQTRHRPKLDRTESLPLPASTIYLPRSASTTVASASCCGPQTSCTLPSSSENLTSPDSDAYILVSLAFTELSPYMSSPRSTPSSQKGFSPTRVAELLYNDNPVIFSLNSTANLVIVPPTPEGEARGRKGELYVKKDVVESVKQWCEGELRRRE